MPIIITDKNRSLVGVFSSWKTAWDAVKKSRRAMNDDVMENKLLIMSPNGRIERWERKFCKCSFRSFVREIDRLGDVTIVEADDGSLSFRLLLSPIDELYKAPCRSRQRAKSKESDHVGN